MNKLLITALLLMSHNAIAGDSCKPSFIRLTSNGKILMTKVSNISSFEGYSNSNTTIFYHDSKVVVDQSSAEILKIIMADGKVECDTNKLSEFISLSIPGGTDSRIRNVYDIEYYLPVTRADNYYTTIHFKGGWNSSVDVIESSTQITNLINSGKPFLKLNIN